LNVPAGAVVYFQGQRMWLTGPHRRFVAQGLSDRRPRPYTLNVVLERNGRLLSKIVDGQVSAGQVVDVTVGFDQQQPNDLVASVTQARVR
jgi:hypothetical protein